MGYEQRQWVKMEGERMSGFPKHRQGNIPVSRTWRRKSRQYIDRMNMGLVLGYATVDGHESSLPQRSPLNRIRSVIIVPLEMNY